jgi:hypothetical protein
MDKSLVTVITPLSRNRDIPNVLDNYLRQDYHNKELTILNEDGRTDYMSVEKKIWVWGRSGMNVGEKRNELCSLAQGEIIVMMDSDDWFAPDYITRCVEVLQKADITGLSSAYFHKGDEIYLYEYKGSQPYVIGSGMAFWKRVWEKNPFRPIQSGEDMFFQTGIIKPHGYIDGFYATIHDNNTASHKALPYMKRIK